MFTGTKPFKVIALIYFYYFTHMNNNSAIYLTRSKKVSGFDGTDPL